MMFKKSLIFLLALTANALAFANPIIKVSDYEDTLTVNYTKFAEPVVAVYDGSTKVTKNYDITYSLENGVEETDSRGVVIVRDTVTNATIEKYYGGFNTAKAGIVTVLITATPKDGSEVLTGSYSVTVIGNPATLTFGPTFPVSTRGNDGSYTINTACIQKGDFYYIPAVQTTLPNYTITTKTLSNKEVDITDYYDVNISYSGTDKIKYENNTLTYSGLDNANQYYTVKTFNDVKNEAIALESAYGTVTYDFTVKSQYAGCYDDFHKTIDVCVKVDTTGIKKHIHLSLTRDRFCEQNITGTEYNPNDSTSGYTIHVYKYGKSDIEGCTNNYQYSLPMPSILTPDGTQLTPCINYSNTNNFKYYYKIVESATYADSCWYGPHTEAGQEYKPEFNETDFSSGKRYYFQVPSQITGYCKVAVYATFQNEKQECDLSKMYEPVIDKDGDTLVVDGHTVYSEPVYFYIDVMKRIPIMEITPDPATIVFAKGDKVYIPERFTLNGSADTSSNGAEGHLIWKTNEGETDEYYYSFFVSDRMNNKYIRVNDWPVATNISEFWNAASSISYGDSIQIGDKILVDGELIDITAENKATYSNHLIQAGDYEHGLLYNAMREWGNESWNVEFFESGKYAIPYTFRPWNHQRWDDGGLHNNFTFRVVGTIPTKIDLEYTFQTTTKSVDEFNEPMAKVIAPSLDNLDITDNYTLSFSIESGAETGTTINDSTGDVKIGANIGDVVVRVHATRNSTYQSIKEVYENPEDAFYTIRIVDPAGLTEWEVISGDKKNKCEIKEHFHDASEAYGRLHFISAGKIYSGTILSGVPGISMTVGGPEASVYDPTEWKTENSASMNKRCCQHDDSNGLHIAICDNAVVLGEDSIPTNGAFYKFTPTVNGYLTIDAKLDAHSTLVLISKNTKEEIAFEQENVGDYTFEKPLLAGEVYYLYNRINGGNINLHGFAYQPAYIIDRNTTLAESVAEIDATTFMNGLSNSLPTIINAKNKNVSFDLLNGIYTQVAPTDYAAVDEDGKIEPKKMTLADEDIFYIIVKATVKSPNKTLGNSVTKTSQFKLKVIDIPTYAVTSVGQDFKVDPGDTVTTTNIKTDIIMTFGGWKSGLYGSVKNPDDWSYKSVAGPATRIGSANATDLADYNKTIDGFEYFAAGNNGPVDENNKSALRSGKYIYATGVEYEDGKHNTTYDLPCRGNFLKFEPRESGTVLLYLVQNGCCSYYDGMTDIMNNGGQKIKWMPLFITDETGYPATMVNDFGTMSKFLPTGNDKVHAGSYTLGVSRCNKIDANVQNAWDYSTSDYTYGTSYDWSAFKGTATERDSVLAAWPDKGERMSIVRLDNGGFVLPQKAYVRYAFQVKAGKTYFVFQPGSKFEFGGFSFVPTGYPKTSKYGLDSNLNVQNQEKNIDGASGNVATSSFTWDDMESASSKFNSNLENLNIDINDSDDADNMKERTFKKGCWTGICLPFSVSTSELKRVFGEQYSIVTCDNIENNSLNFTIHANKYIEAGRPYFIYASKDGKMSFKNVTIEGNRYIDSYTTVPNTQRFNSNIGDEYILKGIYTEEDLPAYSLFAALSGFYRYTFDRTIGGYRAYLRVKDTVQNAAKAVRFNFTNMGEEEDSNNATTGILFINSNSELTMMEDNVIVYNTNGQIIGKGADAINSASHGIYIINGKKIVK